MILGTSRSPLSPAYVMGSFDRTPGHDHLHPDWCSRIYQLLDLNAEAEARNKLDLALRVSVGLPHQTIEALRGHGIPEQHIDSVIIPRRTYKRRRAGNEALTPEESDRVERVARLLALATLVFDGEKAATHWLTTPKRQFENRTPLELAASSIGAKVVEDALLRSYYGFVS